MRFEHSRGGVEGAMEEKRVALDLNETVMRSMAIGATFKDYVCIYNLPLFSALSWGMVVSFVCNSECSHCHSFLRMNVILQIIDSSI